MSQRVDKDRSIVVLLTRLYTDLGTTAFDIVDHWESDLCAIGLAMTSDHATLVYVSTYGHPCGDYDYELETAPRTEKEVYSVAGRGNATYDELVTVIRDHFNLK